MSAGEHNVIELTANHQAWHVFRDRGHAGEILAGMLESFHNSDTLVLGIPAGGMPVAAVIADKLGLRLDFLVVKKITPPDNTEFGYGAIAADGSMHINEHVVAKLGLEQAEVDKGVALARHKVAQREQLFARLLPHTALKGRDVILVDDGLATGVTYLTAIQSLNRQGVHSVTGAVPTAHEQSLQEMAGHMQAIYCANVRAGMRYAVADAYEHWHDLSDQEVETLLQQPSPR